MTNKSLIISNDFNRLISGLAPSFPARPVDWEEQTVRSEQRGGKPALLTWPGSSRRETNPRERMWSDLARLHQATYITRIQ